MCMMTSTFCNPTPSVSWYRNNRKLIPERIIVRSLETGNEILISTNETNNRNNKSNQTYTTSQTEFGLEKNRSVLSVVIVQSPSRSDIGTILRCQASNIDTMKPIIRLIKLDVNLRPTKAVIVDMHRDDMQRSDPKSESGHTSLTAGSTVHITCLTWGSRPPARIRWWLNDRPLNDVKEVIFEANSTTKSTVRLVLKSFDNGSHLRCVAENGNSIGNELDTKSAIQRRRRPPSPPTPTLTPPSRQPSSSLVQSQSISSTTINGTIGDERVGVDYATEHHNDQPRHGPMSTFDQITLSVKYLPNVIIEPIDLERYQPPMASLIGNNINSKSGQASNNENGNNKINYSSSMIMANSYTIDETNKLTLNCNVKSNPEPFKIRWLQNRKEIFTNNLKGIKLLNQNQTLLVEQVGRYQEGRYQCVAYNQMGRGDSREIYIFVRRSPRCALPLHTTIQSSMHYPTNLFCQMDTNPMDTISIFWETPDHVLLSKDGKIIQTKNQDHVTESFKDNLDQFDPEFDEIIDEDDQNRQRKQRLNRLTIASKGVRSRLTIVPQSSADFGIYRCWAQNSIGSNRHEPCQFNLTNQIGHAIVPKPVYNCQSNYSRGLLSIRCLHNSISITANETNSLKTAYESMAERQLRFHMEIHSISDGSSSSPMNSMLLINQTNPIEPIFLVSTLQENFIYQINVYVSNLYGVSEKVTMLFQTPSHNESELNNSHGHNHNMTVSTSLLLSQSKSNNPIDDWLFGGNSLGGTSSPFDDQSNNSDEIEDTIGNQNLDSEHRFDSNGQWPITKPDLQKQNRLSESMGSNSGFGSVELLSHRFIVFLIGALIVSLIIFSVIVSIAIVLCVYRNKREKTNDMNNSKRNDSKTDEEIIKSLPNTPKSMEESSKICTYNNHQPQQMNQPPDLVQCDGLLIFNPSSTQAQPVQASTTGTATLYRNFVSLDSDSSYANYSVSDTSGTNQCDQFTLRTLDPVSIGQEQMVEPKFLCEPNHVSLLSDLNATGFITGEGNVQLVATMDHSSTTGKHLGSSKHKHEQTSFSSPYHLLQNGPFLSVPTQPIDQSRLVFMAPSNDDLASNQSQVNSSFSISESMSELTYHNSTNHQLATFSVENSNTQTTTEDETMGTFIQATTV
ncbi:hypothetical protein RDWZM_000332 [Blomia tropicalis]|uniref:Ig-like domain-containing protein n=1 Tax=Blomia tropicalis TaxID=40697 RepID=A0A9Q0MC71_BLOTA|nr:hypothetical protein RDWZM_000332 [Blomia tropicalis]